MLVLYALKLATDVIGASALPFVSGAHPFPVGPPCAQPCETVKQRLVSTVSDTPTPLHRNKPRRFRLADRFGDEVLSYARLFKLLVTDNEFAVRCSTVGGMLKEQPVDDPSRIDAENTER
ncbi:MAG: hypothetical protein ACE37J_04975 [Pikeienuella sp.]|uniref:hypothetical protein n=1 Tax=Pikeienuella sp. TaxID=2831957 RepID=UPI00391C7466